MFRSTQTLAVVLDQLTAPGELYERLPEDAVRCFACAHRCLIQAGRRGICQVRFNQEGVLRVPQGYAAGIQADPIEKKPFYHVLPGSDALTFGMLGCDMHCSYCFPGDTIVVTNRGPISLTDAFELSECSLKTRDAEAAFIEDLHAVTSSGRFRQVQAVYRHHYSGPLQIIKPYYLPELRSTPEHRLYATTDISEPPTPVQARSLTPKHYLAVPRHYEPSSERIVNVHHVLGDRKVTYQVPWKYSEQDYKLIMDATGKGLTSREIGEMLGITGSNLRHIRRRMVDRDDQRFRTSGPYIEGGLLRFPNERRPGIPIEIDVNEDFARLLGFYCAEGCVTTDLNRPNSHRLNFSFGYSETAFVEEVVQLLDKVFGAKALVVRRNTTLGVSVGSSSLALLFQSLAGGRSAEKKVPIAIFDAPQNVMKSFLDAYTDGDGHKYGKGKISVTTISRSMAYGVAWVALMTGCFPSIYVSSREEKGVIEGREIIQFPWQYVVVWYEDSTINRMLIDTPDFYLFPIREISTVAYDGYVYNMEVEVEHNYLANFCLVSNCQNWLSSQALRDAAAGASPTRITASQLVDAALRSGAKSVISSYNEPLITSEWAVEVFKLARDRDLLCGYVSNGNATAEVLDYLKPWAQAYKIDLKTMQDKQYRQLGAVLQNILDGIRMAFERGFWVEIVTLLVPGFNDSPAELRAMAEFIISVSPDIPWHVTAFHGNYRMTDPRNTSVQDLIQAVEIGKEMGLRYVYAGNAAGRVGDWEHTFCHNCNTLLVERHGYHIKGYHILPDGCCPRCSMQIPGIWPESGGS